MTTRPAAETTSVCQPRWAFALAVALAAVFFASLFWLTLAKFRNYDVLVFDVVNWQLVQSEIRDWLTLPEAPFPRLAPFTLGPIHVVELIPGLLWRSSVWPALFAALYAAASIVAFYLLARRVTADAACALAMAFAYAAHPLTESLATAGAHYGGSLAFFYFLELYFLANRRLDLFTAFALLTNLTRVNAPAINLGLGCALWLTREHRAYGRRAVLLALATAAFMFGATVAVNAASHVRFGAEILHVGPGGATISQALASAAAQPGALLAGVWSTDNGRHLLQFAPLLALPLLAPTFLAGAAIDLLFVLFSSTSLNHAVWMANLKAALGSAMYFHSNLWSATPAVFAAAVFGLRALLRRFDRRRGLRWAAILALLAASVIHRSALPSPFFGPLPFTPQFNLAYYAKTAHAAAIDRAWALIPEESRVKAMDHLYGLRGARARIVYPFFYDPGDGAYDYVLFDLFSFSYMTSRQDFLATARAFLTAGEFGVVSFDDGVTLLKRGADLAPNAGVIQFMDQHAALLAENLLNPYVLGPTPRRMYSPTQLAP